VLFRYQVAGACVLANLPDAWDQTRGVFESMIFGPVDWVGAAAIVALAERARRDPAHAAEVRTLLTDVVDDLVPHSAEPRFWALVTALNSLPGVSRQKLERVRDWYKTNCGSGNDGESEAEEKAQALAQSAGPPPDDALPNPVPPVEPPKAGRAWWPWLIGVPVAALIVWWLVSR